MKILICCAGGFSSSIVEKKLREYGQKVGEGIEKGDVDFAAEVAAQIAGN